MASFFSLLDIKVDYLYIYIQTQTETLLLDRDAFWTLSFTYCIWLMRLWGSKLTCKVSENSMALILRERCYTMFSKRLIYITCFSETDEQFWIIFPPNSTLLNTSDECSRIQLAMCWYKVWWLSSKVVPQSSVLKHKEAICKRWRESVLETNLPKAKRLGIP